MLLTTSRKPSQQTRSFCQKFKKALGCHYINRGKMNIQELLQKAREYNEILAIVFEKHGNPSRITFYNTRGQQTGYMTISVAIPKVLEARSTKKIKGPIKDIRLLKSLMPLKENDNDDFWSVEPAHGKYTMIIELYHKSKPTGFKIFIKRIHLEAGK